MTGAGATTQDRYQRPGLPQPDMSAIVTRLLSPPFSPHSPQPKQGQFLLDFSLEALYGGAAGGGKSDALLMAALQFVDVPGYAAIIFRKSFADLSMPGAIMERADTWLRGTSARWNEQTHTWHFPSGATLTFGYMQSVNDRLKYQGAEFQFVGFDELTQFRESDYRYLFSRVRRPNDTKLAISRVPIRIRGATNPGGPGHTWVYNRFVAPWEEAKKKNTAPKRAFYPATIHDNRYLDSDEYLTSLAELDAVTRAQLENGNWNIRPEGRMFKREWFQITSSAPLDTKWVRYWDLAATEKNPQNEPDWTAGARLGWSPTEKCFYLGHMSHFRDTPLINEQIIAQTAEADRGQFGNVPIYMEQEPGASGKNVISYYARTVLVPYEFHGDLPSANKITRATIVANKAEAGMFKLVAGVWNEDFLDEIEIFPDGLHDDQVDAVSGAMARLVSKYGLFAHSAPAGVGARVSPWALSM